MKIILTRNLEPLKEAACKKIDTQAELERSKYVTTGSLQAMTYQAKQAEANSYLAGDSGPFPLLEAEAAATNNTLENLASTVSSMAKQWILISASIEAKRISAKNLIKNAKSLVEINSVEVDWSL